MSASQNESVSHGNMSEKITLTKKKKAPPQVRQTLTSKFRMLKANPLLMDELGRKLNSNENEIFFTPLKTLVGVLDANLGPPPKFNGSSAQPKSHVKPTGMKRPTTGRCLEKEIKKPVKKEPLKSEFVHPADVKKKPTQSDVKTAQRNNRMRSMSLHSGKSAGHILQKTKSLDTLIPTSDRRATITLNKTSYKKIVPSNAPVKKQQQNVIQNSKSKHAIESILEVAETESISKQVSNTPKDVNISKRPITPVEETNSTRLDVRPFTPVNLPRNTAFTTPASRRKSLSISDSKTKEMTKRLSEWLKRRGKNFGEYHHLKCFGVHSDTPQKVSDHEHKENIPVINIIDSNKDIIDAYNKKNDADNVIINYDDFKNEATLATTEEVNLPVVTQEALIDLHNLILDGYPPEQCETWLRLIKQKYKPVEQESYYWECRAALEQTKGNIGLAVECYKTAIIQGAEVKKVDKSLDQLLEKFNLLNINASPSSANERSKVVEDARNIFKSSIIQFAVQERTFKKKNREGVTTEKKFVATPVRRSTRLSRSAFTSTPGIQLYASLQEVDNSMKNNLNFRCNDALKDQN